MNNTTTNSPPTIAPGSLGASAASLFSLVAFPISSRAQQTNRCNLCNSFVLGPIAHLTDGTLGKNQQILDNAACHHSGKKHSPMLQKMMRPIPLSPGQSHILQMELWGQISLAHTCIGIHLHSPVLVSQKICLDTLFLHEPSVDALKGFNRPTCPIVLKPKAEKSCQKTFDEPSLCAPWQ